MNPALSLITMAMMKKFNQESAWIWNTYQCYLKVATNLHYLVKKNLYNLCLYRYTSFFTHRNQRIYYLMPFRHPLIRVSVSGLNSSEVLTWTKRENWPKKKGEQIQFMNHGSTLTTGDSLTPNHTLADNLVTPMSSKMSMSFFLQSKRN